MVKVNGEKIIFPIVTNMKVNITWTRSMGREYSNGRVGTYTRALMKMI